jgi:hypothetical protein
MLRCYNEETRREIHGQVAQLVERSPEKAGVGGSSPSLATTFSITYSYPLPAFCSILFQFQFRLAGICLNSEWIKPCPARPRYFGQSSAR